MPGTRGEVRRGTLRGEWEFSKNQQKLPGVNKIRFAMADLPADPAVDARDEGATADTTDPLLPTIPDVPAEAEATAPPDPLLGSDSADQPSGRGETDEVDGVLQPIVDGGSDSPTAAAATTPIIDTAGPAEAEAEAEAEPVVYVDPTSVKGINLALVAEFNRVADMNDKILSRLHDWDGQVTYPEYQFVSEPSAGGFEPPRLSVVESFVSRPARSRLEDWSLPSVPAVQSPSFHVASPDGSSRPVFDTRTDFTLASFGDLPRLNKAQRVEVAHWSFFDESTRSTAPLKMLLGNAQAIHSRLQAALAALSDTPSQLAEVQAHVAAIAHSMQALRRLGTSFSPPCALRSMYLALPWGGAERHVACLRQWIGDRTGVPVSSFAQRYQATTDGFSAQSFHARCDGAARLVVLIRSADGWIFGGFSTSAFSPPPDGLRHHYVPDRTAFLFSLRNPHQLPPTHLPVVGNGVHALYCDPSVGPSYGLGHDLHLVNDCHKLTGSYFTGAINGSFPADPAFASSLLTGARDLGRIAEVVAFTAGP